MDPTKTKLSGKISFHNQEWNLKKHANEEKKAATVITKQGRRSKKRGWKSEN